MTTALARGDTRVTLASADGVSIAGTFYEPAQHPAPMVLLLHMQTRSRADWTDLARRFAVRGVGALAIDLRGHGESGIAPLNDPLVEAPRDSAVNDVYAALTWLRDRPGSLPGRIGIVGASLGANLGAIAAADDVSVRAMVLLSATLDFRGVRTEGALRKFGDRAVLLVASHEDGYATRSARELAGTVSTPGSRDLHVLDGAGHGSVMLVRRPDLATLVVDWLCARLL